MRGPSETGLSKARKKSNAKNYPSQAGPSTPAPSTPTHVNQDPMTQEPVIQENVPVNQEHVNQDPVNEVPVNQDPVNLILVNQVHVNLGVRVPKSLGVRASKRSERINKIQISKQVVRKDGKGVTEDNRVTLE
ncbi:unnamed protein product [Lactuca virosa]|uniref:Uncharacterized protein n=1 Tax=Lactuca virosa TaxID=75947 RepID=A0AAU9NVN3_9ASTR|nr:unnamed protein product [Lactuca virosa]